MTVLSELVTSGQERSLTPGEILVQQGTPGDELYVLESGRLIVERDGVSIATLDQTNTLIGEMSVLLGRTHSATVRADGYTRVRVIADAKDALHSDAELTFELAALLAHRLDSTTAMLVHWSKETHGPGLVGRILSALQAPTRLSGNGDGPEPSPWALIDRM